MLFDLVLPFLTSLLVVSMRATKQNNIKTLRKVSSSGRGSFLIGEVRTVRSNCAAGRRKHENVLHPSGPDHYFFMDIFSTNV